MEPVRLTSPRACEYRDLNGNGRMDPFEDPRLPVEERVEDLLGRMSLEEKAGLMFQTVIEAGADGTVDRGGRARSASRRPAMVVLDKHLSHFNVHALEDARMAARWHNALQALAEQTPHGIPVTDLDRPAPRLHRERRRLLRGQGVLAVARAARPGRAARRRRSCASSPTSPGRSTCAVGIRAALHPTLDLATEPRWARQAGTFGQDPDLVTELGVAYLKGFQGRTRSGRTASPARASTSPAAARRRTARTRTSPTAASRSTPAAGSTTTSSRSRRSSRPAPPRSCRTTACRSGSRSTASRSRRSASATTGRSSPGCCASSSATTAWSSPTGSWSTTTTSATRCCPARAWGVEHLDPHGRMELILHAGADQFGGEECVEILARPRRAGPGHARSASTSRRGGCCAVKFRLGLFDDPFVDEDAGGADRGPRGLPRGGLRRAGPVGDACCRTAPTRRAAVAAAAPQALRIYAENVAPEAVARCGVLVDRPEDADVALVRLMAPFEPALGPVPRVVVPPGVAGLPARAGRAPRPDRGALPARRRRRARPAGRAHAAAAASPARWSAATAPATPRCSTR